MDFRFLIFDCRLRGSRDSIRKVPFHSHLHSALRQRRRGAALSIVLASLVFLAALTLTFLASVNMELRSSKVYSAGTNAKLLAQTAVNLATAQISEKTYGSNNVPDIEGFYVSANAPVAAGGGATHNLAAIPGASATNQIIGRVAFWADDETCKVNINTASKGTFMDTSRTYTLGDWNLAQNQPLQKEYQRYPGHPATTSLSAVLKKPSSGFTDKQWAETWVEAKDKVAGEFRGSQTIERFIDPNDPAIPDYADPTVTTPISDFYKTRILQAKQFAP